MPEKLSSISKTEKVSLRKTKKKNKKGLKNCMLCQLSRKQWEKLSSVLKPSSSKSRWLVTISTSEVSLWTQPKVSRRQRRICSSSSPRSVRSWTSSSWRIELSMAKLNWKVASTFLALVSCASRLSMRLPELVQRLQRHLSRGLSSSSASLRLKSSGRPTSSRELTRWSSWNTRSVKRSRRRLRSSKILLRSWERSKASSFSLLWSYLPTSHSRRQKYSSSSNSREQHLLLRISRTRDQPGTTLRSARPVSQLPLQDIRCRCLRTCPWWLLVSFTSTTSPRSSTAQNLRVHRMSSKDGWLAISFLNMWPTSWDRLLSWTALLTCQLRLPRWPEWSSQFLTSRKCAPSAPALRTSL